MWMGVPRIESSRAVGIVPPELSTPPGQILRLRVCHFHGIVRAMRAVIDRAGRIVVPKPLRQALGLKPGQSLEIRAGDGRLEIEVTVTPMRLKKRGKGLVAVPRAKLPALTADQVRDTLERVRR
jgi:AbrB family looped-hinge helix DNA binding protein